jgi:hypothetical protein
MATKKITTCKAFKEECLKYFNSPADLMKEHFDNNCLSILDADNLLDFNEGWLNLEFTGTDCTETFLFIDGVFDGTSYID